MSNAHKLKRLFARYEATSKEFIDLFLHLIVVFHGNGVGFL